jgi:hypothetical protein
MALWRRLQRSPAAIASHVVSGAVFWLALAATDESLASASGVLDGPPATFSGAPAHPCKCEPAPKPASDPDDPKNWHWEGLPNGLIYRSYLAGVKEPRMYLAVTGVEDHAWFVDMSVGGRVGLVRYGNGSDVNPEGYQLDFETAGMGRLDVRSDVDLRSVDLRVGMLISHRINHARVKIGYYHLSSHVGDEYLLMNPDFVRINYSREALVLGLEYFITPAVMPYVEVEWGTRVDGGSEPWEFQLGVDVSPAHGGWAPFAAVNGYLRQEVGFSGNFVAQIGWQYRRALGQRIRAGLQYTTGRATQFSFFREHETTLSFALWYDF